MKNKQCFFGKCRIFSFFRCLASVFIILISVNGGIFGVTLPNCNVDINGVDDNLIPDLIQLATTGNNTNKLFLIVKKDEFDKGNMCYTATDSYVKCDNARIKGVGDCTDNIVCESGYSVSCESNNNVTTCKCKKGTETKDFTGKGNCTDFNNYISCESKDTSLDKACYPENHICLKYGSYYKNNEMLYKKDVQNENDKFYVYKKNIINSGTNKNCEFYVFPCDYKIRNESAPALNAWQNQVNLVVSGTANDNNKLFVKNIFGSLGNMSFFIQAGECDISNGTCSGNCSRDSGDNQCSTAEVIKKSYYYKYYDSNRNVLFYYEKNIATGKENNIGRICNKYLPNCVDLRPNDSMVVLYQNKSNISKLENNTKARIDFYKNNIGDGFSVNEANLYYLSSPGAADALCLSKEGAGNIDIGYCSDIGKNGSLKYRYGLTLAYFKKDNTVKPNCYLKSCIDLTPEEFEVIKREGAIDKKYCSEYYWLSNSKSLKYFPKEKPIYCSDIENGHLKFSLLHEMKNFCTDYDDEGKCKSEKDIKYYAGGGLDREKGNCYVKNCYSLTKDERKLVADAKINNIGLEIERACPEGSNCDYQNNFKSDNIPVYCDNGFLFNKDTPGYTNFEPINLNVIPCYEFQKEQLNNIGAERVLLFTELIGKDGKHGMGDKKYNTDLALKKEDSDSRFVFCRTHYVPLNLIKKAEDNGTKASFLRTRVILANEEDKAGNINIYSYENKKTLEDFGIKYFHDDMGYQKVKFTSRKLDEFKDVNNYMNILSFVDNVFPYYNADLAGMQSSDIFNGNEIIGFKINAVKQKNSVFFDCLNDENRKKQKQSKDDDLIKDENCKDCVGGKDGDSQEKCLYNKKNKDNEKICMKYVPLDYECKRECCDGKDSITENYCYIEDFAKEKMSNANFYIAETDNTGYLDCPVYAYAAAGSEEYKKFTNGIIGDFLEEVGKDKLDIIKAACDDLLPIVDDRKLPEASILQQLIKPNKVDINFSNSSGSPGKHDLERYGCTKFNEVNLYTHGLYGCKLPDIDSSYFNTILNPVNLYNGSEKPTEQKITDLSVCSRYQNDVLGESSKCGQREGSQYRDKCLDFSLDVSDRNSNTLDDSPQKSKWIFEESTGGSRFRTFRENRDIYAIRDFHTYHYCSATENFEGKDDKGAAYVYAAGFTAGAAIGTVACPIGCIPGCIFALFATGACIAICIPVCIVATAAVTGAIYLAARYDQWNLNLQNDLQIARGYNLNNYQNKGFITPTLVTDNNNYIYRFYSRSDDIEEDLANKLNANSEYFKENTLGIDILKKCGISVIPKDSTGEVINFGLLELTKSEHDDNMGYNFSYKIKKFEDDGKVSIDDCGESDIKNCLNEKQRKCVEGYGVSFFDGNFIKYINKNFMLNEGGFLKRYNKGDIAKDDWGSLASPSNKNRDWLPVDIIYNTLDTQSEDDIKQNGNCKIGLFGDPIGDLSRCRGFSLNCKNGSDKDKVICNKLGTEFSEVQTFFTESQALKLPLAGHPFFFYTLLTPKNTPEMFDPSIFVEEFCKYSTDAFSCKEGKSMTPNDGLNKLVLNFFEPILKIGYEYNGGIANNDFKNHFTQYNNFISYISSLNNSSPDNYSYSCPYQVKYKSNYIQTERQYTYVLHRTFEQGAHDEYIPKVCLYRIVNVEGSNSVNTIYNFYIDNKCSKKDGVLQKNGYIIIDNNVMCFPRAPLSFDNLVLAESPDINYNRPYINSKITDKNSGTDYKLMQSDGSDDIMDFGESRDLGFGLNFTRSYCSKLYYDYYKYVDQLEKGGDTLDQATINRINKSINSIESYVRSDCDKENGYESEFLINESEMKSKIDDENKNIPDSEVVFKETVIVRKNNSAYGGFNELCVSDYDIDNIFSINKEYAISDELTDFPEVFAFASDNNDGVDTKCLLSDSSREDTSCMVTDRFAYLYLTKAEEENYSVNCEDGKCKKGVSGCNEEQCRLYVNVDSLERIPLKKYECVLENGKVNPELLTDVNNITDEIAEKISACYKGGFNYAGIVHDSIDSSEVKTQCKCKNVTTAEFSTYNNEVLKIRRMTPREYGLCIDLKKPIICPAVRYYDSTKTYVDDNLALGKTQEEMDEKSEQKYYEQHLWRTAEKIAGIIPSVFYSNTLGHAEFPASLYCEDEKDCLGESKNVTGSCLGYWKNGDAIPTATCEVKTYKNKENGKIRNVYEYKLKNGTECVRYRCPGISGNDYLDEFEIDKNASNVFTAAEITDFNNINRTDYRSFINNEEIDVYSVDKRGLSNGFAAWRELESGDFAKDRYEIEGDIFVNCLTGYGLAGSNNRISDALLSLNTELIRGIIKGECYYKVDNNVYLNNNLQQQHIKICESVRNDIYKFIYSNTINLTKNASETPKKDKPKRYCNQKGEWMPVEDVYNKMILDSSSLDNNLYHSGVTNLWLDIFNKERTYTISNVLDENTSLIDKVSQYGYCERLVCRGIEQPDENYYIDEFFNEENADSKTKDIYKFWLHSGGANWKVTSAPRNSSNKITNDANADPNSSEFSSRSLTNIFSLVRDNEFDDYIIGNKYKYLKKVKGECRKEFGYYNRGTSFSLTEVAKQVSAVNSLEADENSKKCTLDKELCKKRCINLGIDASDCSKRCSEDNLACEKCVDSRKATSFAINGNDEPYRVCTSVGVWGEVNNKCVRSCELLHLYRTNVNSDLYSSNEQININDINKNELKIENHDVISFNSGNISYEYMEGRFLMYDFRNPKLKNERKYTQGDSIFGGANWPRSIVNVDNPDGSDCDSNGKCLRYVEVEGVCNKEYDKQDVSDPTQYGNSTVDSYGNPKGPTRKCYEDGTWGPISNKCFLEKTCAILFLSVSDIADLIAKYNNANTNLNDLNHAISDIYAEHLGEKNERSGLLTIDTNNGLVGYPISCNGVVDNTINGFESIKVEGLRQTYCSSPGCCENAVSMVCNSSGESCANGVCHIAGWSFNTLELEKYFIPKTCNISLKRDPEDNNIYYKIYGTPNTVFSDSNDLFNKIDRLNFGFAGKISNYPIKNSAKHYTKESQFDSVYNKINNATNSNYKVKKTGDTSTGVDIAIPALYDKTVNINGSIGGRSGSNKVYYSHQIYATCDNRYFYNEVSGNDYYNKLAIFSCQGESGNLRFKPEYTDGDYILKSETSPADACKPKTCGSNSYQIGWSLSQVKEFVDNNAKEYNNDKNNNTEEYNNKKYEGLNKFSQLTCPDKYAFVIKKDTDNKLDDSLNVGSYFSSNNESYEADGLVSSLKLTCTAKRSENAYTNTNEPQEVWNSNSSFKIINGKTANNAYDANRYGDLQYNDLPKTFCKDIAKNDCKTVTETEIINNGDIFSRNADDNTNPGYCVRMGCPRLNLKIVKDEDTLKATQAGNSTSSNTFSDIPGTFTLPLKYGNDDTNNYYDFGDVVVIQSLDGDYSENDCPSDICGDDKYIKKFVQYTSAGVGNGQIGSSLCGYNQDIYNDGGSDKFSYNYYFDLKKNEDRKEDISNCFNNLSSKDSLSKTNVGGYTKINDSLYVKYRDDYKSEINVINNVKSLANYTVTRDNDDIKGKANDLFKKYTFDKISISNGEINNNVSEKLSSLREFVDGQIKTINDYAVGEAKKLSNGTNTNVSYHCLYDDEVTSLNTGNGIRFTSTGHGLFKCGTSSCKDKEVIFIKNGDDKCKKTVTNGDKQETVSGSYYLNVNDFETKFNTEAEAKRKNLSDNFKASDSTDATVKSLYTEYYDFYLAESYFKAEGNACRIKYYNSFISEIIGSVAEEDGVTDPIIQKISKMTTPKGQVYVMKSDGEIIMNFEGTEDDIDETTNSIDCSKIEIKEEDSIVFAYPIDENGNISFANYEKYINNDGVICKNYSVNDDGVETIKDCNNSISIPNEVMEEYENYYLNIFEKIKPVINDHNEYYKKKYQDEENKCKEFYSDFLDEKSKFGTSYTNTIKNGLFMAMKCTPEGWIVQGKPSCKKRCSSHADFRIDPDGAGDFDITIKIDNLRHSINTGMIEVGAHRGLANCSAALSKVYGRNGASFSCNNGEMTTNLLTTKEGGVLKNGYKYHSNGLAWHIYCSGTFSAFGITTQRNADVGGFFHTVECNKNDSFCWRDHYENDVAVLCPNSKDVHKLVHSCDTFYNCINDHKCDTKFDTVTTVNYEANFH